MVPDHPHRTGADRYRRHRRADDVDAQSRHGHRDRSARSCAGPSGHGALRGADPAPALGAWIRRGPQANAVDHRRHGGACERRRAGGARHRDHAHPACIWSVPRHRRIHSHRRRRRRRRHVASDAAGGARRPRAPRARGDHRLDHDDRGLRHHRRERWQGPRSLLAREARGGDERGERHRLHPRDRRHRRHREGPGTPANAGRQARLRDGDARSVVGAADAALHDLRLRLDARLQFAGPHPRAVRRRRLRHDAGRIDATRRRAARRRARSA